MSDTGHAVVVVLRVSFENPVPVEILETIGRQIDQLAGAWEDMPVDDPRLADMKGVPCKKSSAMYVVK